MASSSTAGVSSEEFPPLSGRRGSPSPHSTNTRPAAAGTTNASSSRAEPSSDSTKASSWRSLFGSSTKLQFFEPSIEQGKPVVCIPKETQDLAFALSEDCLIGQFFGPAPRLAQIQGTISSL